MKFEYEYLIGVEDVGKSNQITNFAFLKYLEEIACYHSSFCGFGVNDINTKHKAWLLMDWQLKVFKRPIYGEKLLIKTWARILEKNLFFSYRDFEIYCNNEKVAIATSKWVLFDFISNKITKLTDDIYLPYNPEDNHVFENKEIERIKEIDKKENLQEYIVKRGDIDINRHMHNLNYLKLAYETLPEEIYFSDETENVRIMYKHQIRLGEKVNCYYSKIDGKNIITIKSNDNGILHAIIELY